MSLEAHDFSRVRVHLQDADYCKMAEAMGGVAYTVRTPDELEALIPMLADEAVIGTLAEVAFFLLVEIYLG